MYVTSPIVCAVAVQHCIHCNTGFTLNGKPLEDISGDKVAFRGFRRDVMYVPAVTVFLGEKVQLILTQCEVSRMYRGWTRFQFCSIKS